ncbi:unnamed protein product [Cuscuta campestris]|uniref:Uncharacterized protein n=1 Tax=Cuscuta campestris TaxID=132261 RepID=A0A484LS55_9ASTE|nr:unnamed protein product [Cuscuta campestris]
MIKDTNLTDESLQYFALTGNFICNYFAEIGEEVDVESGVSWKQPPYFRVGASRYEDMEETPDVFTDLEDSDEAGKNFIAPGVEVIEQLPSKIEGHEGATVGELVPDSEEEDEPFECLKAPKSDFIVCVGIDGSIPEIETAVANMGKRKGAVGDFNFQATHPHTCENTILCRLP